MFNPFRPKTVREAPSEEFDSVEQPAEFVPAPPPMPVAAPVPLPPIVVHSPPPPPPPRFQEPVAMPAAPAATGGGSLSTSAATALEQLVAKLPGLLFAGLTEVDSGNAVRGRTPGDLLPAAPVARYHADLIRLERQTLQHAANGAAPEVLREILVTMSDQLHLLRLVRDGQLLLSIVLDPRQSSLPTARMALQTAANIIG